MTGRREEAPRVSAPAEPALTVHFDLAGLYKLRSSVAAHAGELGLRGDRLSNLLVVATELATNAVRHGGGAGVLRLWSTDGTLYCQVVDEGPGMPDPHAAGTEQTPIARDGGRGLWLVRQFSDDIEIINHHPGLTFTVSFALSH
jgi:anti-sigma regulatory factor (Ser/Thr protein kinase)